MLNEKKLLNEELKEKDRIIEVLRERCDIYFKLYMQEKELNKEFMQEKLEDLRKSTEELKNLTKEIKNN